MSAKLADVTVIVKIDVVGRWLKNMKGLLRNTIKNRSLVVMALPAVILLFCFSYMPMSALVVSFKKYDFSLGIFKSPWIGFENFNYLVSSKTLTIRLLRNTIGYYVLFTGIGTVCNVALALAINECRGKFFVKTSHTIMIMPTFISWVAVTMMANAFLSNDKGILNQLLIAMGSKRINWYLSPKYWPVILLIINLWKGVGYNSIIYLSALAGMDPEVFEAADLDGASKMQKIRYITLPMLTNLISIQLLLSLGGMMHSNTGLFYRVTHNTGILYSTTQTIDAYVLNSLASGTNFGMTAAVTLFQSIIGAGLLLLVNGIVRKIAPENALF